MVNLLFISNSTKIDAINRALQPLLKVKIDIVADFDYGLKDVFEKRPATVFIQDQIAGVTGESVARHIQMLLGASAPSFIFMHDGSPKAKPIKGLFEYLIDLSQTDSKVVTDIQATLKSLLGPQWDKIYIPPKIDRVAIRDALAGPEENRAVAERLVEDFISDLDTVGDNSTKAINPLTDFSTADALVDGAFQVVSSPQDQLAEMFSESSRESAVNEPQTFPVATTVKDIPSTPAPDRAHREVQPSKVPKQPEVASIVIAPVTGEEKPIAVAKDAGFDIPVKQVRSADSTKILTADNSPIQPSSPADFIICTEIPGEPVAPEELLRVFEGNYYSQTGGWKRYALVAFILTLSVSIGCWYVLKRKPLFLTSVSTFFTKQAVAPSAPQPPKTVVSDQKPVPAPEGKADVSSLPSFIPQEGLDSAFASQKPGWSRYVGADVEFRTFSTGGKIKALQVLGINNNSISEPKLKSILIELLGDGEYRVTSREHKLGFDVSRATAGKKAELLIYRKKSTVRAFVVSLD